MSYAPILAALNNSPGKLFALSTHVNTQIRDFTHPTLFLSTSLGATERTYVHVQMNSRMTSSNDWKLKSADFMPKSEHKINIKRSH
jgi:hypothetical protein